MTIPDVVEPRPFLTIPDVVVCATGQVRVQSPTVVTINF